MESANPDEIINQDTDGSRISDGNVAPENVVEYGTEISLENLECIRLIYENIMKCQEAFELESNISRCIAKEVKSIPQLTNTVESLLTLASSGTVDAIYYANVFKYRDESTEYTVNRFFEFGAFEGFNEVFNALMNSKHDITLLPYAVHNNVDVIKKSERENLRFQDRRKGGYFSLEYIFDLIVDSGALPSSKHS